MDHLLWKLAKFSPQDIDFENLPRGKPPSFTDDKVLKFTVEENTYKTVKMALSTSDCKCKYHFKAIKENWK